MDSKVDFIFEGNSNVDSKVDFIFEGGSKLDSKVDLILLLIVVVIGGKIWEGVGVVILFVECGYKISFDFS